MHYVCVRACGRFAVYMYRVFVRRAWLVARRYKAYSGESSVITTLKGFVDDYMSTGELSDTSEPRCVRARLRACVRTCARVCLCSYQFHVTIRLHV